MKGIFVNENGGIHYADLIVNGIKEAETRSRDMLKSLVGERVAIVKTRRNKRPTVVGYATIYEKSFVSDKLFRDFEKFHLVPEGSSYDSHGKGKWLYWMKDARTTVPFPLPDYAVYHGRSWCEF